MADFITIKDFTFESRYAASFYVSLLNKNEVFCAND